MFRHPWNCPDCDEVPTTGEEMVPANLPELRSDFVLRRSFADMLTAMDSR